jgi:hypothetical protein
VASLLLLAVIGWYGYSRLMAHNAIVNTLLPAPTSRVSPTEPVLTPRQTSALPAPVSHPIPAIVESPQQPFHCDGRTRCSQMTSCAEATFFIKQCPGTQMDGDGDGVPCESQWCTGGQAD